MAKQATTARRAPSTKSKRVRSAANPSGRIGKINKAHQEAVRDKLKADEYIQQLTECATQYKTVIDSVHGLHEKRLSAKSKLQLTVVSQQLDILELKLKAIKGLVDLNIRRLKYCLPELRAIEISDPSGNNPFASLLQAAIEANR